MIDALADVFRRHPLYVSLPIAMLTGFGVGMCALYVSGFVFAVLRIFKVMVLHEAPQ